MDKKIIKGILSFENIYQSETDSSHKELEILVNGEWITLYEILEDFIDKEITLIIK